MRQQLIRHYEVFAEAVVQPAPPTRTVDSAVAALRSHGVRVSAARQLVLETLFAAQGPVSAESIAGGLGGRLPGGDLASVYRNLETLERLGLVAHVHLGHGPGLYSPAGAEEREHLSCERCGAHRSVPPAALDGAREVVREALGWQARFTHFPVVGRCPACAERSEDD